MIVLVTGLDDSGRDDIIETVLQSYKNIMPASTLIKAADFFPDFISERSLSKLSRMRDNSLPKLEKAVVTSLKKGGNIILSAAITRNTVHGYIPAITREIVDTIKPDLIVMLEILPQRVESYMQHEHIDWTHQNFEKQMSGLFSMRTGSPLKIIRIRSGKVRDALKDTADVLRSAME